MGGQKRKPRSSKSGPGPRRAVLITGGRGYVGGLVTRALAEDPRGFETIVSLDVREPAPSDRLEGVLQLTVDNRSPQVGQIIADHGIDTVVHLASIVSAPPGFTRQMVYDVDVGGTRNLLDACLEHGVRKLIVTSSGAAYGYHADNAPLLTEDCPLRGNEEFPYSHHKRLVEEMLAEARREFPALEQLIFRPGTILGEAVSNPITDLFEKPVIVGVREAATPFTIVWDRDVVGCLLQGVHGDQSGIYNISGDGVLTLREIASLMGKPYVPVPEFVLRGLLTVLQKAGITQYGPEQTSFLRYRPVPSNEKLKREFGYVPRYTTREVFDLYRHSLGQRRSHRSAGSGGARNGSAPTGREAGGTEADLGGSGKEGAGSGHSGVGPSSNAGSSARVATGPGERVVVITGAAGGIGRALAWRFAREGARIGLLDIDPEKLTELAVELGAAGTDALVLSVDIRRPEECERALGEVVERWGGIDVLINNAGITHRSLFQDTDAEVLQRVMDVNFFGAVHCTRAALPSLLERRGMVVAISSVAGFAPLIGRTGYSASKHALHGFFDSLRSEVASRGVGVLLICPGFVDSGLDTRALGGDGARLNSTKAVVGRMFTPEQVADEIHDAVKGRERLRVVTRVAKSAWWVSRLAPALYERIMRSKMRSEFPV